MGYRVEQQCMRIRKESGSSDNRQLQPATLVFVNCLVFSIFLLKTLLYNILSTLYSKVLSNNILELGRKMFFIGKASHFAVCVECIHYM